MSLLCLRNRQKTRATDLRLLRKIVRQLLSARPGPRRFELAVHLVDATEMAALNNRFLQHAGSTDVITFSYRDDAREPSRRPPPDLSGEIFVCLDDAVAQAKRLRTTWQSELVRYIVHGVLHLEGFDDREPAARKKMKREENRLLRGLSKQFPLHRLEKKPSGRGLRAPDL